MFKKTMMASALLLVSAGAHSMTVATIATPVTHTIEGLNTAGSTGATATNAVITLGAEFVVGDKLVFTYSTPFSTQTPVTPAASFVCDNGAATGDELTFGLYSADTTTLTYRLTGVTDGTDSGTNLTTTGAICVTPTIELADTSLATAGATTLNITAQTVAGVVFDTVVATSQDQTIAKAISEFTVGSQTAFDAIIDLNAASKKYESAALVDAMAFTPAIGVAVNGILNTKAADAAATTGSAPTGLASTVTSIVTTVTGSVGFSYLDTAATAGMQLGTNTVAGAASHVIGYNTGLTAITITDNNTTAGASSLTITKNVAATVIPAQTFTAATVFAYDTGATAKTASVAMTAGSWKINGATITAYSVPFSSSVERFLWVSNTGTDAGTITAVVKAGGVQYPTTGSYALGSAAGKTNTRVGQLLDDAMTADGVSLTSGRGDVTFTVNAASSSVTVTAGYKVADDRVQLETTDSLN